MTKQTVNEIIEALAKAEPLALKNEHENIDGKGAIGDCGRCDELIIYYFGVMDDGTRLDDGRMYCPICGQKFKRGFPKDTGDQKGGEE